METAIPCLGCKVRCETDFVRFWIKFEQNKAKQGQHKFNLFILGERFDLDGHINEKLYEILCWE